MTGWCPYKTGTLGEQECHFDGYCYECDHYRSDIISRREALDVVKEFKHDAVEWRNEQEADSNIWHRADSAIASAIEIGLRIKKIQSEHQWIPCSERLPEVFYVLCCDKYGEMLIANPFECDDSDTGYSAESDDCYMYNCVAWMPLPEPYKAEE